MFSVKWIEKGKESEPVEVESSILIDLERVFCLAKDGLEGMRMRHIARPPDGFIVDRDGEEVRRWYDPRHEHA